MKDDIERRLTRDTDHCSTGDLDDMGVADWRFQTLWIDEFEGHFADLPGQGLPVIAGLQNWIKLLISPTTSSDAVT